MSNKIQFQANNIELSSLIELLRGKAGSSGSSSGGNETIETCTLTIVSTPPGYNLVCTTLENGEVVMKSVYLPLSLEYLYTTITCIKNSFICIGKNGVTATISSNCTLSGDIELIGGGTQSTQAGNTVGRIFKITGDASISITEV